MHDFNWFSFLTHNAINHHNVHMVTAGLVVLLLIAATVAIHSKLRQTEERVIPSSRFSLVNLFEAAVEAILSLMESVIGPEAPRYFPLIGSLFIYIFLCNIMALIPGFLPPTDNINTNFACSITVFVYYNAMGIKAHGFKNYLKHFMGPIVWLGPLMFVIEMIGHLVRPVSLALRLFGNITGDHLVLGIFSNLVPLFVPVIFLALGLFVSFIQAFVFSLLSMIYINLATAHEEGHEGAH